MAAAWRPLLLSIRLFFVVALITAQSDTEEEDDKLPPRRKVPVPPLITEGPMKTLAFRENESLKMVCVASGEPTPEYTWQFNNELFNPSGNDGRIAIQPGVGTLIFARPIPKDAGIYQCFASNKHGTAASVKVDLRLGILQPFPPANVKIHEPDIGMSLTLRCVPPQSFPIAQITWGTVETGEAFLPIELSSRVSIDPVGNLHFANILAEDRKAGRQYACSVWNSVMHREQKGSFQIIRPRDGEVKDFPPAVMWVDPATQTALRGGTLRIKCIFAGRPTPRVKWSRDGDNMPSRKREDSFGQELVIENVQSEDAGRYECQGTSSATTKPLRKSFTLTVGSAPYWLEMPRSVDAAEGDKATFRCVVEGNPQPVLQWHINGIPITKIADDPRRKVEGNTVVFTNLTMQDAMVFQCNASNTNGYIYANAYLNVQAEPPVILDPPVKVLRVAEGQTVNITCKVFGSPKPRVVWSKGLEQLTGGNFRVLPDGNLQIERVSLVDAGEYTCVATNKWDNVSASGKLIVRRRTQIQTRPLNVIVYEEKEVKFTCTATTDAEEIANLEIVWKKDRQAIDYRRAQRMFRNNMDNSLTISGTMSLDTATYTCMATNGLDSDEADAQLVVQGVPDPPEKIIVRCFENETPARAVIEWQPAKENYAPILNFIIQYNTTFAQDQWIDIAPNISQNDRSLEVILSPWVNYTFRVLARNKIGLSEPGEASRNVCRTQPDFPSTNPHNLIGEGDEPNNLVIFWTPTPKIEQSGENYQYFISYKGIDAGNTDRQGSASVSVSEFYYYLVPQTTGSFGIYQRYDISITGINEIGTSSAPATQVVGYSGEDAPLIKPTDIVIVNGSLTSTQVTMQWPPVDTEPRRIRGFFRGYRIQYWSDKQGETNMREADYIVRAPKTYPRLRPRRALPDEAPATTETPLEEFTIRNLRPFSSITIQIRVLNKYYAGPPSDQLRIETPEGEPGPPRMFETRSRGPTHFELSWALPTDLNGNLVGFNISYQILTDLNLGRRQYREEINDPSVTRARLTGLKPDMDYRIYLSAATSAGAGEAMFLDARTTPAGAPNPASFSILDIGDTFVTIGWEPSRKGNPGSVFYIQYRIRGEYHWKHSGDEPLHFKMTITNLDPGTTYQMRVVAKNGVGLESSAEWQEVTTGGLGPGRIHLGSAGWFYGIFVSLLLILLFMVGFVFLKRARDDWWESKENKYEDQVRDLQAKEAARQMGMGIENQYAAGSREDVNVEYAAPVHPGQPGMGVSYQDEVDEEEDEDSYGSSEEEEDEGGFTKEAHPSYDYRQPAPSYSAAVGFHPGQLPQARQHPAQGPQYPQQGPQYPQQGPQYPQQGPPYPQQGPPYPQQGPPYPQQGPPYPQQGPLYHPQGQHPPQAAQKAQEHPEYDYPQQGGAYVKDGTLHLQQQAPSGAPSFI